MLPISSVDDFLERAKPLQNSYASELREKYEVGDKVDSGLKPNYGAVNAWHLPDGNTYVSVPLEGEGVWFAAVGALISPAGTLLERTEISVRGNRQSGYLKSWSNGLLVIDTALTNPVGRVSRAGFNWSKFNNCLTSAGIPAWAITAISIACTAACAGTAGVGCIVCASAAAAVAGGTISYCMDKAS